MVSINIAIKKEAYDFLRKLKTKDKSFSDVILGFKKKQSDIMGFFGILKEMDWEERVKSMQDFRKSFSRRLHQ